MICIFDEIRVKFDHVLHEFDLFHALEFNKFSFFEPKVIGWCNDVLQLSHSRPLTARNDNHDNYITVFVHTDRYRWTNLISRNACLMMYANGVWRLTNDACMQSRARAPAVSMSIRGVMNWSQRRDVMYDMQYNCNGTHGKNFIILISKMKWSQRKFK